ncbi:glycosyltransferase family 61 protein [Spirosoma flavum]|uniref:Glycosyltransferase family 61 protein n=1 Tax=Spirosoma flavum TaxID=2048557 RepID=A0ABW6ALH6_9BACT
MQTFFTVIKDVLRKLIQLLLKQFGVNLLTKEQTEDYLEPYLMKSSPKTHRVMPNVQNHANSARLIFRPTGAVTHQSNVWNYVPNTTNIKQLPYGGILVDTKVLCTDFESHHVVKNFLTAGKRTVSEHHIVIAPWSHYLDGISFGGYYDFVILVAAKLCRIRESLPEDVFSEAVLSYPLFKTAYEQEYLALIGFEQNRIFDSRLHEIRFNRCILGNSGHWFYPNPADIMALKKLVEKVLKPQRTEFNRIYISRAGRRRVANEANLITLLEKYNFIIIEDKPRSVAEQVTIYKNASFIMGPHGASFTNIIWCEPGTHLFELFSSTMVIDHFRYLSQAMDMTYSAYCHDIKMGNSRYALEEDIFVSIADLEKSLNELFEHA